MKNILTILVCSAFLAGGIAFAFSPAGEQIISSFGPEPSTASYLKITEVYTGDWQKFGQNFTNVHVALFSKIFLLVITIIPAVFLLHYLVIGAKDFSHEGRRILFFNMFCRFIHWVAAISFTLLVITGLMIIFGGIFGGGALVRGGRTIHILSSLVLAGSAIPMFLIWLKDMFPAGHDVSWLFMMGGYLSKEKKPVPAGKFNAGQKTWFWIATVGSGVMAYTGYILYAFQGATDQLRFMTLIHNYLGALMVAFFIIHLYMALFAIKGALSSMITGYKPQEEVEILHSKYNVSDT
jgi:formate dehydrogenase subunit gamma